MRHARWAVLAAVTLACESPTEVTQPTAVQSAITQGVTISAVDLGTLGGEGSQANAINTKGQVVGYSEVAVTRDRHAFLWYKNAMKDLGTLGGTESYAEDINDKGQVVGYSGASGGNRAFLWENGVMKNLGVPTGYQHSFALGINNKGDVVGYVQDASGYARPALWSKGTITVLGSLDPANPYGQAYGIANDGSIVGVSLTTTGKVVAVVWSKSGMTPYSPLAGHGYGSGLGLNVKGQVAGNSNDGVNYPGRAVLWTGGVPADLGDLGAADSSEAWAVNNDGHVVGSSHLATYERRAFIWTPGTGMVDLGTLGGTGSWAADINHKTQVVGMSFNASGDPVATLWNVSLP